MGGARTPARGLLLAVNGKQKMAWEKFGKEGNFSVSSSLEKSILSHPSLPAEGEGFPNTAQAGFARGEERRQKAPGDFTRDGAVSGHRPRFGRSTQPASRQGQGAVPSSPWGIGGLGCPRYFQSGVTSGILGVLQPCLGYNITV